MSLHPSKNISDTLSLRKAPTFSISTPQNPTQDPKLSTLHKKGKGESMAANQGRDAVVEVEKEKLRNKIQKTEATIADQQKRISCLKSAGRELLVLFVALYGRFLWIINGGQGLRCSDYWFFLGYYMFLCAVGWSLAVNGVYYILSIKESDRTLNECKELKKTLAVLDGSNIPNFDGEPSQNAFGVFGYLYQSLQGGRC